MIMPVFAQQLKKLLNGENLPITGISNKNIKRLRTLIETGVVSSKRINAGRSLKAIHLSELQMFADKEYPSGLDAAIAGASNRAECVALFRNAKHKRIKNDRESLLVKAFSDKHDLLKINNFILPVTPWCEIAGIAGIQLKDNDILEITGRVALVENIEVFWFFEEMDVQVDMVYYTAGRFSGRFLNSLTPNKDLSIIHFGDYDPVGVDEYLKIKKKFKTTEFYIPDNIESLFKYGKTELLSKNKAILRRLRKEQDQTAVELVGYMDKYNKGLEHEILLTNL